MHQTQSQGVLMAHEEYESSFTFKLFVGLYILVSLQVLAAIAHCGTMVSFMLTNKRCKSADSFQTIYLICSILGGCAAIFGFVCWLILLINVRRKMHDYFDENEEILSEMKIVKAIQNNNKSQKNLNDKNNTLNEEYEANNTLHQLNPTTEGN